MAGLNQKIEGDDKIKMISCVKKKREEDCEYDRNTRDCSRFADEYGMIRAKENTKASQNPSAIHRVQGQ